MGDADMFKLSLPAFFVLVLGSTTAWLAGWTEFCLNSGCERGQELCSNIISDAGDKLFDQVVGHLVTSRLTGISVSDEPEPGAVK
jgi:hypothetical protein